MIQHLVQKIVINCTIYINLHIIWAYNYSIIC